MPRKKQKLFYYCTKPFCAWSCEYNANTGIAISNHECHCFVDFDICQETEISSTCMLPENINNEGNNDENKNAKNNNDRPDNDIQIEGITNGEHVETDNNNIANDNESNAWTAPDDECFKESSEGSMCSNVSDNIYVPCFHFDEYDATKCNNDEVSQEKTSNAILEQQNVQNEMETATMKENTLLQMLDEYQKQQNTQEVLTNSMKYAIELLSILKRSNVSNALYDHIVE